LLKFGSFLGSRDFITFNLNFDSLNYQICHSATLRVEYKDLESRDQNWIFSIWTL